MFVKYAIAFNNKEIFLAADSYYWNRRWGSNRYRLWLYYVSVNITSFAPSFALDDMALNFKSWLETEFGPSCESPEMRKFYDWMSKESCPIDVKHLQVVYTKWRTAVAMTGEWFLDYQDFVDYHFLVRAVHKYVLTSGKQFHQIKKETNAFKDKLQIVCPDNSSANKLACLIMNISYHCGNKLKIKDHESGIMLYN